MEVAQNVDEYAMQSKLEAIVQFLQSLSAELNRKVLPLAWHVRRGHSVAPVVSGAWLLLSYSTVGAQHIE